MKAIPMRFLPVRNFTFSTAPTCHGQNARGMRNAISLRTPQVQHATAGELVWFLRNGNLFHGMPSWSGLPEQRRWQIVTYLKSLR